MHTITTIGLDIAKSVHQVHGVDAAGQVAVRRQLKRHQVITFLAAGDFELADVTGQFSRARANTFGLM
jgi:hypothetical protein